MVQTNEDVLLSRAGMPDKIGSTAREKEKVEVLQSSVSRWGLLLKWVRREFEDRDTSPRTSPVVFRSNQGNPGKGE